MHADIGSHIKPLNLIITTTTNNPFLPGSPNATHKVGRSSGI